MANGINDRIIDIHTKVGTPAGATVSADIAVIDAFFDVPAADVATNTTVRDVVGNKTDAAVQTVAADKSLTAYIKGTLNRIGAPIAASISADIQVIDVNVDTIITRIGVPAVSLTADISTIDGFMDVPSADAVTNSQFRDVLGNKSDAAQTTVGTTRSVMAYAKGLLNRIGAPAGASIAADIAALGVSTISTNVSTVLTRIGTPGTSLTVDLATIDGFMDVPAQNATTNAQMRDVIGNKTDGSSQDITVNNVSLMRLIKGIIESVNPASAADNATAAASAYVSDTLGRKDDTATVTVSTTATAMRYIKGILTDIESVVHGLPALEARLSLIEDNNGGTFNAATDSLESIRNAISAIGGNSPHVYWAHNIPSALNLNDATVNLSIYLTDEVGNLITGAEITPGTCRIREWTGATWVERLAASANSESSGIIYQTETFNAAAGYTSGNSIEIQFSGCSVTADSITTEIPVLTFYSKLETNASGFLWGTNVSGSVTADGTEQTILETNALGNYADDFLLYLDVDLNNMAGGDTTVLRAYSKIDGSNFRKFSEISYSGAQALPVWKAEGIHGNNSKFVKITLQQSAGVNRSYAYEGNVCR